VVIDTHKGSIRVSTWDRAEVDVTVRIEEDPGFLPQPVNSAELRIHTSPREVRLESYYFAPFFVFPGSSPFFHYTVRMPRTARLRIRDHKSETEIEGLAGDLDVDTHKGTVRVRDLSGALTLSTHKGDAHVGFASFNSRSRVTTHKGHIELDLPRQAAFDLQTDLDRKVDLDSDFTQYVRTRSRRSSRYIGGPVNGGGPVLALRSHKGTFRLRQR
jgi:hypothetical protein